MIKQQRPLLIPTYLKDFVCIGSACEDTCCAGWQVSIDQNTYKKYKNVKDKDLQKKLNQNVTRVRSNSSTENYAKIKMDSKGFCPLLDEGGLCSVHKNLGESYLSNVCSTYPKQSNVINNVYEKSGTISCPEMARLALLNPNGIEFEDTSETVNERLMFTNKLNTNHSNYAHATQKYFWELRVFTITVLQNRSYSIEDRLIILGMFYKKLQEYIDTKQIDEIPLFIANQLQLVEDGHFKNHLNDIPVKNNIQLKILKEVINYRVTNGSNGERYLEVFKDMLNGIGYSDTNSEEENAVGYQKAYDEYYSTLFKEKEYILENYLVNYVFKNMFPLTNFNKMFDEYVLMVVVFATLKMHIIGAAAHHKENYSEELIIKTFQSFSREVEHNPLFLRKIHELLSSSELNKLSYMAILIKN